MNQKYYKMKTRKQNLCKCTIILFFLYLILYIYNSFYISYDNSQVIKESFVEKTSISTHFPVISKMKKMKSENVGEDIGTHHHPVQRQSYNKSNAVFIAAVLSVRIYETDKAKLTKLELKQWIEYMLYAGVERVYLYNNFRFQNESLQQWCKDNYPFTVVYHDWHKFMPFTIMGTQIKAYTHAVHTYKNVSTWQIAFDMDEYPFMANDSERGFLKRFLERKMKTHPHVSEWSLRNFLFLGKPLSAQHILKRYLRRTPEAHNTLDKPIFLTRDVQRCGLHHNYLKLARGISMDADPMEIRMNHYWGARLQNWGDDTIEVLNMTIPDDSILDLVKKIENSAYDQNI